MKRIFLTGASGCIGHYVAEALIQETGHELFLLVRDRDKLKFDYRSRPNIHILPGDLREIEQYSELLETIDVAILVATSWGGIEESYEINVVKMITLIKLLNPQVCEQIVYFSTASILNRQNQLLEEAGKIGTNYIRTKYECYSQFSKLEIAPKITTVFPTLVFGGSEDKPYSHISADLPVVLKWMDLVRWFKTDASFHFIHARDIAQVVRYLVDNPPTEGSERNVVLGNKATTVNEAVEKICAYLNRKIYLRLTLSMTLANFFIKVFRLRMAQWDKFSLEYRHFTHEKTFTPATFGLVTYCPTIEKILELRGISRQ